MQHTLAILHMDEAYAYSLMDFMNQRKEFGFKVYAFTNQDLYFEFQKKQKVHVLLFDEIVASEERKKVNAVSMYYLSDNPSVKSFEGHKAVFMYQSVHEIITQISEFYTSEGNQLMVGKQVDRTHVIGICSLSYDQTQCDLILSTVEKFADLGKTLFLSFQPFLSKALPQLGQGYELSEAIYLIKKDDTNLSTKLKSLISNATSFDIIIGLEHYSDITDMTAEEVMRFLEAFIQIGIYQYIVLDLPIPGGPINILLSQCEKIIEPESKDCFLRQMKKEFHRQLILKEGEDILARIQEVALS